VVLSRAASSVADNEFPAVWQPRGVLLARGRLILVVLRGKLKLYIIMMSSAYGRSLSDPVLELRHGPHWDLRPPNSCILSTLEEYTVGYKKEPTYFSL